MAKEVGMARRLGQNPFERVRRAGQIRSILRAGRQSRNHPTAAHTPGIVCESLEARKLLSSTFSAQEVYLAELVNRARSDPQAEEARLGFSLTDGLTQEELALFGPVEPLALESSLASAARAHSLDMINRAFFDHINPDGVNPTGRAQAAGYSGVAGESIAAGQPGVDQAYESWMFTPENRVNILSLFPSFTDSFHYDQIGPGFATNIPNADNHYTAMFGDPGSGSTARLLGVVYDDTDSNAFYSIGEGAAGIQINVAAQSDPSTIVSTFTTDDAGNYQIVLGTGDWIVTFTDSATGNLVQKQVSTTTVNVKLDTTLDELLPPSGDGGNDGGSGGNDGGSGNGGGDGSGGNNNDHANDGQYDSATRIVLDNQGNGQDTGNIETNTDTDLFYFTTTRSGQLTITLDTTNGSLTGQLTLESDAGLALAIETATQGQNTVNLIWNVPDATQYFVAVGAAGQASTGGYTLTLAIDNGSGDSGNGSDNGSGDSGNGSDNGSGGSGNGSDNGSGDSGSGSDNGSGDSGNGSDNGSGDSGSGGDQNTEGNDPPVDVTSDNSGAFTIVRTDANGNPIVYLQEDDGSWTSVDLIGTVGGPTPEGRFSTFVDPETNTSSIVSATASGLAVYGRDAQGSWSVRNLSTEIGAAPIASKPVTFTTKTGLVYAAGLDAKGGFVAYRQTGKFDAQGRAIWEFDDIAGDDLASQGLSMPDMVGATLVSYVTAWNGLTIAGLDVNGNIQAAWWVPGMDKWSVANLSQSTGAPKYIGTISAYLTPWNGINLAGTDENSDLSVVWWVPSFGGQWKISKLNEIFNGPQLLSSTIASWVTPWGGLNISGLTAQGKVVVYWWAPGLDTWQVTPLSDFITNVDPPVTGVIGHTARTGVISVMGLSQTGDLVRYWWQPGSDWTGENITLETQG